MAEEQKNKSVQRNQLSDRNFQKSYHNSNIYHLGHALIIDEEEEIYIRPNAASKSGEKPRPVYYPEEIG